MLIKDDSLQIQMGDRQGGSGGRGKDRLTFQWMKITNQAIFKCIYLFRGSMSPSIWATDFTVLQYCVAWFFQNHGNFYPQNEEVVNYKIANYFLVNLFLNNFRHQLQAPLGTIKHWVCLLNKGSALLVLFTSVWPHPSISPSPQAPFPSPPPRFQH